MRRLLWLLFALSASPVSAQVTGSGGILFGANVPATCSKGDVFASYTLGTIVICTANNTWATTVVAGGSGTIPTGAILLIDTGACPTGFTEVAGLSGRTVIGTVAANGNVGATGGSDSVTATVASLTAAAQVFTGSSANTSAITAGTPAGTNSASATTGNCAATNLAIGTGATTACKATAPNLTVSAQTFTGSALGTHQHTLTATGTNGTSAVTGTLNSVDNRSAFENVIFCKKT